MPVGNGSREERATVEGDCCCSLTLFSETILDLRWLKGIIQSPTRICCGSLMKLYPPNEVGDGECVLNALRKGSRRRTAVFFWWPGTGYRVVAGEAAESLSPGVMPGLRGDTVLRLM